MKAYLNYEYKPEETQLLEWKRGQPARYYYSAQAIRAVRLLR